MKDDKPGELAERAAERMAQVNRRAADMPAVQAQCLGEAVLALRQAGQALSWQALHEQLMAPVQALAPDALLRLRAESAMARLQALGPAAQPEPTSAGSSAPPA